jgi:hypothetical protein
VYHPHIVSSTEVEHYILHSFTSTLASHDLLVFADILEPLVKDHLRKSIDYVEYAVCEQIHELKGLDEAVLMEQIGDEVNASEILACVRDFFEVRNSPFFFRALVVMTFLPTANTANSFFFFFTQFTMIA